MKTQLNFKLIDGIFDIEDAAEVLRMMIRTKINHHKTQKFSLEERFGEDHTDSEKRIKQLRHSLEQMEELLAQPELKNQKLTLLSEVSIKSFVKEPELAR